MQVEIFKRKKLLKGLTFLAASLKEIAFSSEKEIEDLKIFTRKAAHWIVPPPENKGGSFYKTLKKEFILGDKKMVGFFCIDSGKVYEVSQYLWEKLTVNSTIEKLFPGSRAGMPLKKCVKFTKFLNKVINEISMFQKNSNWDYELPFVHNALNESSFINVKNFEEIFTKNGDDYYFKSRVFPRVFREKLLIVREREIEGIKINDVLFKFENSTNDLISRNKKGFICVVDGKMKIPGNSEFEYFSQESRLKVLESNNFDTKLSSLLKTIYLLKHTPEVISRKQPRFKSGVYFVCKSP
ncbi:hypothetical protein JXA84_09005, partial [candidate division WOR-3 bacterium]|nr:hypothetical protein [candidate division WOR-3 bacterium]